MSDVSQFLDADRAPTKVTVNLVARSVSALDRTAATCGDTRTDIINRAIQLYHFITLAADLGPRALSFDAGNGRRLHVEIREIEEV
jgi:hypothetical protein